MTYNKNPTQQHRAAAYYAHHYQWKVFPVRYGDKIPLTMNGVKDATLQQDLINKWWTSNNNANIGIATGWVSGFIVIDIDEGGEESLEQLTEQYGQLPDTIESITGSGGRHILLQYPNDFIGTIKNKVNFLPNVDIRGDGGYIVAPPSLHASGNFYEWELSSRPGEVELQPVPDWLLKLLVQPEGEKVEKKPNSHWTSLMQGIQSGGRNNAAAQLAGHLFRRYIDPILVMEIMELWNERNDPPLSEAELYRTVNSIAGKELARRNGGEFNDGYR